MAINREWHAIHKLSRKATLEERLNWHVKHAANCLPRDASDHQARARGPRTVGAYSS